MFGKCPRNVWEMFEECLRRVWEVPRNVWEVSPKCLGSVWEAFEECLKSVWEVFEECLGAVWGMLVDDSMPHSMSLWLFYQAYLGKGRSSRKSGWERHGPSTRIKRLKLPGGSPSHAQALDHSQHHGFHVCSMSVARSRTRDSECGTRPFTTP